MAAAPADFGPFSNALLVANFGDGRINAFDPATGNYLGTLSRSNGAAITIDGLWGIAFGNGINAQPTNTLFFTGGPARREPWRLRPHRLPLDAGNDTPQPIR